MKAGAIPLAPGKLALTLIVLALAPLSAYGTGLSPVEQTKGTCCLAGIRLTAQPI